MTVLGAGSMPTRGGARCGEHPATLPSRQAIALSFLDRIRTSLTRLVVAMTLGVTVVVVSCGGEDEPITDALESRRPNKFSAAMPPMGGASLAPDQVKAVAGDVYSLNVP